MDKIRVLAEIRGESEEEVTRKFKPDEIQRSPAFNKHIPALRKVDLDATGVDKGLAWVRLANGRVFFSPVSPPQIRRQFPYIADTLPAEVTEDTLLAAIDVVQRYLTDFTWPPKEILPNSRAARIIELGAYLGHKTIRFAEELASNGGQVLAVEMMPDNCEILRRNIEANGLSDIVQVLPAGVWNKAERITGYSKGRQRNSILPIDKLENGTRFEADTRTLDQIIVDWAVDPIDLVFVTVNGVETQALEGFSLSDRVNAFFVAAPYVSTDGNKSSNADACRSMLIDRGYRLVDVGNANRVVAVRD